MNSSSRAALAVLLALGAIGLRIETQAPMLAIATRGIAVDASAASLPAMLGLGARQLLSILGPELLLAGALAALLYGRRRGDGPGVPLWVAPWVAGLASLAIRQFAMKNAIWVSDEWSYDFEARLLLMGKVWCKAPPFPEHFIMANVVLPDGRWASQYSLGWPTVLALGRGLGLENVITPVLTALTVYALELLTLRWVDLAAARWCGGLCLLCPFLLLNGATLFPHVAFLLCAVLTLLWVESGPLEEGNRPGLAGLAFGFAVSLRQPEGALLLIGLLSWLGRCFGRRWRDWALGVLGALATGSLGLFGNWCLLGNPLLSAYTISGDTADLSESPVFKLKLIVVCATRLLAWMPPLTLLAGLAALRWGKRSQVGLLLLIGALYLSIFSRPGHSEFGTRYLLVPALLWLPLLAQQLELWTRGRTKTAALALLAFGLAASYRPIIQEATRNYGDKIRVEQWLQGLGPQALIFFRADPDQIDMGNIRNTPGLEGQIRVWFLDPPSNQKLRQAFASRPAYIVDWDPKERVYTGLAFEADRDVGFDCLCGGFNLARIVKDPQAALATWDATPADSPWKTAAVQNADALRQRHP